MDYEMVIGLETHVQLLTRTKMFCSCRNAFTHDPNSHVCEVCLGNPGVLPVANRKAFELGIRGGLALNCRIPPLTKFDRKHYYYPDLPKNYQISQYDMPLCVDGYLDIVQEAEKRRISIVRAHLEEDAGKLIHSQGISSVDLNRTGTPLLEVVTGPDLHTPAEAKAYLELLKRNLQYAGVSSCNMEEGHLRVDGNISLRPKGETELGVKNEIKNMNSFRAVESALTLVGDKLREQLENGEEIKQVTWGYNLDKNRIFKMRVKEYADDYRYFPEPDLPSFEISSDWVEEIKKSLPELPALRRARFLKDYGLTEYDAHLLTQERSVADYFEAVVKAPTEAKAAANWVTNDVLRAVSEQQLDSVDAFAVKPEALAELIGLLSAKTINMPTAREIFSRLAKGEETTPEAIVAQESLGQVADSAPIQSALEEIIAGAPDQVAQLEGGKTTTAMWFVGQIMRAMKGKADPAVVQQVIAERFGIDPSQMQKKKKK